MTKIPDNFKLNSKDKNRRNNKRMHPPKTKDHDTSRAKLNIEKQQLQSSSV